MPPPPPPAYDHTTGWTKLFRQTAGNYRAPEEWMRYSGTAEMINPV